MASSVATDNTSVSSKVKKGASIGLVIAALGVVFGDIATSPLYAMGLLFAPGASHHVSITEGNVLGLLSIIFWLVTLVVTIKYCTFILRADNHGEGGTVALLTLLREKLVSKKSLTVVGIVGLAGMSLFLGDAVITPAISVLSAVEGIKMVDPGFTPFIVPTVLVILIALFSIQRKGTAVIGKMFGPAMVIWMSLLALMGIAQIAQNPSVLRAINPWYAISFIMEQPVLFIAVLSILLLTITGVEALFSDLGHFGRKAIFRAWMFMVFPALALNYFGQGALLLKTGHVENLFFSMVPTVLVIPLVIISCIATIIAAQAVISGAFSLIAQATTLSYLPRTRLRYPSGKHGQVYVPLINWIMFFVVATIVVSFGSAEALSDAYGISVVACMLAETILFVTLVRKIWHKPLWMVAIGGLVFGTIDVVLLISCMPKILTGAWFPLVLSSLTFMVFWTWHVGRSYLSQQRAQNEGCLKTFVCHVNEDKVNRLPATAVYLHPNGKTVPISMRAVHDVFDVVHAHTLIVSVKVTETPTVEATERANIHNLGFDDGIFHITLNYGFNERINVPNTLKALTLSHHKELVGVDMANALYYISKFETDHVHIPNLSKPLERLFVTMKNSETNPIQYYKLPLAQTVTLGTHLS